MAWFSKETKSLYIARPAYAAKDLVYLHPDKTIPRGANLTVRSDECVLFFREGRFVGRLDAGTHTIDTGNIPFLGHLLVDKLTDGNHFITELFFVALSECKIDLPFTQLGQYQDLNSRHVVAIQGTGSFTVRVKDPVRLVVDTGGQSGESAAAIIDILNGRLANGVRKSVGKRSTLVPVLNIVSNADAEAISTELLAFARPEFESMGLDLIRVLNLDFKLDDESLKLLRDFGRQESGIALQSKGAQVASQAGFAEYNLVQGQRAALEGMGRGFAAGKTTMFMGGGLGADLTRPPMSAAPRPAPAAAGSGMPAGSGPAITPPRQYFIVADGRESGPYTARQVALLAVSNRRSLADVQIRADGDPADCVVNAEHEPAIALEYKRRAPSSVTASPFGNAPAASPQGNPTFDLAFNAAAGAGTLKPEQVAMLAQLARSLGVAASDSDARAFIEYKMRERNILPGS